MNDTTYRIEIKDDQTGELLDSRRFKLSEEQQSIGIDQIHCQYAKSGCDVLFGPLATLMLRS